MENKAVILIIEDDKVIRKFISTSLKTQGYKTIETDKGQDGLSLFMSHNPDIIILDLGLPDIDGLEIIKQIRTWSNKPIVVVSARGQEREKVEALDLGADDYLTKPFGISELLARLRVSLRHSFKLNQENQIDNSVFMLGELKIDFEKRTVELKEENIHLTPTEYKILTLLAQHAGKVLTHNFIMKKVWGTTMGNESQSLRVFMATLRRKIEEEPAQPRYILTEVGVGYRMVEE